MRFGLTHAESSRMATELPGGSWSGMLTCECGWERMVTDLPNEDAVDLALHGAWVVHEFRG
jgi:hypothetical protein